MVPVPPVANILGNVLWKPFDVSGISLDWGKLESAPKSLVEDGEQYREILSENGWEVQRTYLCNWSDVPLAMQYFYGYSFAENQFAQDLLCPTWNGLLPDGSNFDAGAVKLGASGLLYRVIPAQDPYRPYLYADHVECLGGVGVPLQDPNLFLTNILGQPLDQAGIPLKPGQPPSVPTVPPAYPAVGVGPPPSGPYQGFFHFEGLIAIFNDVRLGDELTLNEVTATIQWNDGQIPTESAGDVAYLGQVGQFAVSGVRDFKTPGPWNVTVIITRGKVEDQVTVPINPTLERTLGGAVTLPDPLGRTRLPGLVFAENRGPTPTPLDGTLSGSWSDGVAKLRVTYRQRPYVIRNDLQNAVWQQGELGRYVERQPRYAIQGVPLYNVSKSGQQLIFTAAAPPGIAGQVVPEAGMMLMPTASWIYRWHDVPFYPDVAIATIVGRVNSDEFDGIAVFPSFPPGTLLCQAPEIKMRRNACGQPSFDVSYILDYRPDGWNNFPAASSDPTKRFFPATWGGGAPAADGSNLVFKPTPFINLFAPDLQFPLL